MELTTPTPAHPAPLPPHALEADAFARQLLAAMLAFRDGDFAVRLPSDVAGVSGKIADAFNEIVGISDRRARETTRVSHAVGKEGKLKQRMSLPRRGRRLGRRGRLPSTRSSTTWSGRRPR